ncbi:MAG: EscU/YscU/HrcU family type III secretion system export apparatus switch protein [Thalassovita sp.]
MSEEDSSEKSHEPSQRKLDQARKKGEIARSNDLITASAYTGLLLTLVAVGAASAFQVAETLSVFLAQAHSMSDLVFAGNAAPILGPLLTQIGRPLLPWVVVPMLAAITGVIIQKAFVFAPSKLEPRLSRISLIANAKNKFGAGGLFEFLKSFSKLLIFTICLGIFLERQLPILIESLLYSPQGQLALMGRLALQFVMIVVLVMLSIGGIDFLWQQRQHLQKNRMSHKELRDEHKEAEGDPHLKQERRARAQQVSANQMAADVKDADVVVVNPTHYAVALKWSRKQNEAPTCVAKGVDAVALRIREIAGENGVPIHSDPPTARALYSELDVGDQIQEAHFRAVAVAIRFAEEMRNKVRKMQ